jgi:hypothetical protein
MTRQGTILRGSHHVVTPDETRDDTRIARTSRVTKMHNRIVVPIIAAAASAVEITIGILLDGTLSGPCAHRRIRRHITTRPTWQRIEWFIAPRTSYFVFSARRDPSNHDDKCCRYPFYYYPSMRH